MFIVNSPIVSVVFAKISPLYVIGISAKQVCNIALFYPNTAYFFVDLGYVHPAAIYLSAQHRARRSAASVVYSQISAVKTQSMAVVCGIASRVYR